MSIATPASRTLAELLVERGALTVAQCAAVKKRQAESGETFEQALEFLGFLTNDDIAVFKSNESPIRVLKLEDVEIDREAVHHVPAAVAHRHHLIPVRRSGNSLAVAMSDPSDSISLDALHQVTDFDIIPFAAREDAIEHAIYLHYGEPVEPRNNVEVRGASHSIVKHSLTEDERLRFLSKGLPLRRRQSFKSLVVDAANQFAVNIARAICAPNSEEAYNPFLCWGASGSGKTHLLNALGNELASQVPTRKFYYTTGVEIAEHLYEAIRDGRLNFFRYLLREVEVLIIDDVHCVLPLLWVQKELVEMFKNLSRRGGRLVLSADSNIACNPLVLQDFRAGLDSGVIAAIGDYSLSARQEILRRHKGKVELSAEVLDLLATEFGGNIADMLRMLQQTVVMALQDGAEVSCETVRDLAHVSGSMACRLADGEQEPNTERACEVSSLPMLPE